VEEFRSNGEHMARKFKGAHILVALHRKIPESLIMHMLGVGRTMIGRPAPRFGRAGFRMC